jgi:hypothetical protein
MGTLYHIFTRGSCWEWITWDRAEPLCGCSFYLCQLRTDVLAPVSKYWTYWSHASDMSLVSLVAGYQQKLDFSPVLLGYSGREAGYNPTDRSVGVLWVGSGTLLLGNSGSVQICWRLHEKLLYVDCVRYVWYGTISGLSMWCVCHVGWVFSARCTSIRIVVTHIWVTACLWSSVRR